MKHKRLLSILLAFVLVLSLLPALPVFAANYNIMICGKTVTDANKDDVLGDGSVSFKQVGSSYYLYLNKSISWSNGATLPTIYSTLGDYLYIIVKGDVTVKRTSNGGAISHNSLLYISGNGDENSKLTVIGTSINNEGAIYSTGEIDIYHANVDVQGGQYGIHAGGKLEIKNSTVAAKGSYTAIYGEGGLSMLDNMGVIKPVGGQVFGADIRNADGSRATDILLAPVENYDLKVCGKQVTSANCSDIMGDGVFEYLPEENFLVVRGNCEHHDSPIIESSIEGLAISVMADSVLTAVDASAIVLHKDTAIGGTGKLTVSGGNAIYADGCELMLYKAKISATGSQYGIRGNGTASLVITETYSKVALQKTEVYAKGGTAAIGGFESFILSDCYIKTPELGKVSNGTIVDKNGNTAKTAEIVAGSLDVYDLTIKGVQVTSENKDNLADGAMKYDPATKTLTVTGDVTDGPGAAIESSVDGLTVKIEKDVNLFAEPDTTSLIFRKGATITGSGKLTTGRGVTGIAVYGGATLKIDNANLSVGATNYGIQGAAGTHLVIKNSTVTASNKVAAVSGFTSVTLNNCYVKSPEDGEAKDGKIVDASGATAKSVEIVPGTKPGTVTTNPFVDVHEDDWFYTAVMWATTQEPPVTNGTDATHFAPNKTCTRAEVVQFLYNAAGKPAVSTTDNPFVDVPAGEWYYTAVLWAVENNITNGTDPTHFAPTKTCTRAEVVQFVWNFKGKPAGTADISKFTDVPADAWYASALKWAIQKNVTSGTGDGTTFSPTKKCSRAEIVQFIYKASLV